MHAFIFLFLALTVAWLFYWAIIRQSILDSVKDDLDKLRNEVDWKIINNAEGSRSKAAQKLVLEIHSNRFICWMSLGQIVYCMVQNRVKIKAEAARERAIFESSPKWITDARVENIRLTMKACLANSPTWWPFLAVTLLCAIFSKKVSAWWNDIGDSAAQMRSDNFGTTQPI